jgi:hypothetical protein
MRYNEIRGDLCAQLREASITCIDDLTYRVKNATKICGYLVRNVVASGESGIVLTKVGPKRTEIITVTAYFDLPEDVRECAEYWFDRFYALYEWLESRLSYIDINPLNVHHGVCVYRMELKTKESLEAIFDVVYSVPILSYCQVNDNLLWQKMLVEFQAESKIPKVLYLIRSRCEGPSRIVPGEHVEVFTKEQLSALAGSIIRYATG